MFQNNTGAGKGPVDSAKDAISEVSKGMDGLNKAAGLLDTTVLNITSSLARMFIPTSVIEDTAKLQQLTFELSTKSMGQTSVVGNALMTTMAEATFETTKFGIGLEENLMLTQQINDVMGTNTLLSSEQVINMQLLARNAGLTSSEIVPIVEGFRNIGVGTSSAISQISDMQKQARDYGINVGKFMKDIGSNIKMLSSYNFKDGVEGFSRMIAKAQALRMDVSTTFALSEKLMDPETAIETAAGFQMLGGAVGDLGDPFKLLHLAQTDTEGLQDAIIGMAEGAAVFNEETGEFDIPVTEMYRLREAAKLAGISYQDMTQTAFKAAERTKKLDMLGTTTVPQEFKDLVANMSDIEGGQLRVDIPAFDEMGKQIIVANKAAADLTADDFKALEKANEVNSMSDRDIAMQQLTALQKIAGANESAKAATILAGTNTEGVTDILGGLDAYADVVREGLDASINKENLQVYGEALSTNIANGFKDEESRKHFRNAAFSMSAEFATAIEDSVVNMNEKLPDNSLIKDLDVDVEGLLATAFKTTNEGLSSLKTSLEGLVPQELIDNLTTVNPLLKATASNFSDMVGGLAENAALVIGESVDEVAAGTPDTAPDTTIPPKAQDFISRPGMPVQRFLANDLVVGGTNLLNNLGLNNNAEMNNQTARSVDQNDSLFKAVGELRNMGNDLNNMSNNANNNVNGDINLNVGGKIDLSVDGRNLPQNITSEQLANEIVNNPTFTSKLMTIFTDSNNTYSA